MKNLLTLLLLISGLWANATYISKDSCTTIAKNIFYERTGKRPAVSGVVNMYGTSKAGKKYLSGYTVNFSGGGWVWVQNQNAINPLQGFGTTGEFGMPDSIKDNIFFWINARSENTDAASYFKEVHTNQWNRLFAAPPKMVKVEAQPMLMQTKWNQSPYTNDSCPPDPYNNNALSLSGCGAIAQGQIFKYWGYAKGTGSFSYTPYGYPKISVDFSKATYNIAGMPLSNSKNASMAQMVFHCGAAQGMMYSAAGSGSYPTGNVSIQQSYKFFNYKIPAHQLQKNFTNDSWIALLKAEIGDRKRPVQYYGFDAYGGGHTWDIDGYTVDNLFHCNWGWGGYGDGWFNLNSLTVAGYNFSSSAGVLTGIEPNDPNIKPGEVNPTSPPPPTPTVCNAATNLQATEITPTSAKLSWTPDSTNTGFRIMYSLYTGGATSVIPVTATSNPFVLTGLKPGSTYNWYVNSWCGTLQKNSPGKTLKTPAVPTIPCSATAMLAGTITHNTIPLSWHSTAMDSFYTLRYKPVNSSVWATVNGFTSPSIAIANLQANTAYNVEKTTVCKQGNLSVVEATFSTINPPAPPSACPVPTGMKTTPNGAKYTASCDKVQGVSKYYFTVSYKNLLGYEKTYNQSSVLPVIQLNSNSISWKVKHICQGTESQYSAVQVVK